MQITFRKLKEVEDWIFKPYEEKLEIAHEVIRKALSISKRPCVSFSAGKNSLVVLHMVLQYKPDVAVVFCDTTNEFAETYKFVKRLKEEWNLNLYWIRPKMNFWECVKKYGFPDPTRFNIGTPACCRILKEEPAREFCRKKHIDLVFTGLSAFESRVRKFAIAQYGLLFYSKKWNCYKCHPLGYWTEEDVWKYIEENSLSVNEAYEKYGVVRIGCKYCTGYVSWKKVLSRINPKVYKKILKMMGQLNLNDFEEG